MIIKNSHSTHGVSLTSANEDRNGNSENRPDEICGVDLEKLEQKTLRELNNYVKLQKNSASHDIDLSIEDSREGKFISE